MSAKVKTILSRHFSENLTWYFVVILCFSIGVASGVFSVKALSGVQKEQLIDYLVTSFKATLINGNINSNEVLWTSVANNLKTVLVIWVLAVSIYAFPLLLGVVGIRGFVLGFTVGFIIDNLGYKGMLFSVVSILPQNIIYIPVLIILSVVSTNYSIGIIRNRKNRRYSKNPNIKLFLKYSILCTILWGFLLIGCIVESYISPAFLKGISTYLFN